MANTPETDLYNALQRTPNLETVRNLIEQGVDCNLSYFDRNTCTFIFPIQLATQNDQRDTLHLLYERRNSPTKLQLEKHLAFYINHYDRLQPKQNETLFEYTVCRLLYTRIIDHGYKTMFNTLIAALLDYDNAEHRRQSLSGGLQPEILLLLRIYTLFRKIIHMKIYSNNNMLEIIEKELLHNLETYYFLVGILHIPGGISQEIISQTFSYVKSLPSHQLLIKYYECIANNVISKIKRLEINEEYTIPTGWQKHAVCVSFLRISQTHILIRIDNSSSLNPPNVHRIHPSTGGYNRIIPRVLGQLHVNDLEVNLNYFILLIDSVKRDLTFEEGSSLIYNQNGQIVDLEEIAIDNMPSFIEQAHANCFVKCFEPGYWIRFGERHQKFYQELLISEVTNACVLARFCEEEHQQYADEILGQFILLAERENMGTLPTIQILDLQDKLKASYKQHYKYLSSNENVDPCSLLNEKFIPLRFETNNTLIELQNIRIRSRILMVGDAGCGKSTVCQYITYSWAFGNLWRDQFEWLFHIKMRNLNSQFYPPQFNNYSLIDVIERECFQGYTLNDLDKQRLTNLFENPSNILWILDGLDERRIPEYLFSIERELFAKPNLFLTSRSYGTHNFEHDVKIQIQNFTFEDIEKYIHNYFPFTLRTMGNKCWSFIRDSYQLLQTARIPACLEIICSLWKSDDENFSPDMTMGKLYEKMCDYLLRRYLRKFHGLYTFALVGRDIY